MDDQGFQFTNNSNMKIQEPTPSFNSQKQASADAVEAQANGQRSNLNKSIKSQEGKNPSYTPVRRNGPNYQRTKPQSPKILLPQCFLDQPMNPQTALAINQKQAINKVQPGNQMEGATPTSLQVRNKSENG